MNANDLSWKEAIRNVLAESEEALHYSEIAEKIASLGLKKTIGADPKGTVATILSTSLKDDDTPFMRIGRGLYALRERPQKKQSLSSTEQEDTTETGAVRSFGMFWEREHVYWGTTKPKLLGHQSVGATTVDFADQHGIYLLHDRERVIYVGRAAGSLSQRLRSHGTDRLGGRWDRFSWFGTHAVNSKGELIKSNPSWSQSAVVDTLEAVLIESLEPPLNRRGGDNFSGVEYLQVPDPAVRERQEKAIIEKLLAARNR